MSNFYDIFISYRRQDSEGRTSGRDIARTLKLEFERRGYSVFFDYSEIRDDDFEKIILPAVQNAKVFLLVLSKDSLDRCVRQGDWVRREIETAICSGCKIIPLNPDGVFKAWPSNLPTSLSSLTKQQISEVAMGALFEKSIDKLIEDRIDSIVWAVSLADVKEDIVVNGESLSSRVKGVFSSNITTGVEQYHALFCAFSTKEFNNKKEITSSVFYGLKQVTLVESQDIRKTLLSTLISEFEKEIRAAHDMELLLYILGSMMLFYHLRQLKMVYALQNRVSSIQYQQSFWQRNRANFIEAGYIITGVAAFFLMGSNPGMGWKAGHEAANPSHKKQEEEKRLQIKMFTILKEQIAAIKFG